MCFCKERFQKQVVVGHLEGGVLVGAPEEGEGGHGQQPHQGDDQDGAQGGQPHRAGG